MFILLIVAWGHLGMVLHVIQHHFSFSSLHAIFIIFHASQEVNILITLEPFMIRIIEAVSALLLSHPLSRTSFSSADSVCHRNFNSSGHGCSKRTMLLVKRKIMYPFTVELQWLEH